MSMNKSQKIIEEVNYQLYCSTVDRLDEGALSTIKDKIGVTAQTAKTSILNTLKVPELYKRLTEYEVATTDAEQILNAIVDFIEKDKDLIYRLRNLVKTSHGKISKVKGLVSKLVE